MVTCDAVEERIQERANEKLRMHEIISATLDSVVRRKFAYTAYNKEGDQAIF